jgi:hypothetical protein
MGMNDAKIGDAFHKYLSGMSGAKFRLIERLTSVIGQAAHVMRSSSAEATCMLWNTRASTGTFTQKTIQS